MKKHVSILFTLALALIVAAGMTVFASAETETQTVTEVVEITYGDANGDNTVNMKDVLTIRKYVAGIATSIDLVAADTNGDGVVNMKDVLTVRKFVAGIIKDINGGKTEPSATEPTATATEPTATATEPTTEPTSAPTTAPTTAPTKISENTETVFFGSYEQDGDLDNGEEPIEWIVLEEQDGAKLLLSRYVLDYRMQSDHYCENYQWGVGEDVRRWLNNEFYDEAFSEEEKPYLQQKRTIVKQQNPSLGNEDVATYDWVSFLSAEELAQYFDLKTDAQNNTYSEEIIAEPTPAAAESFEFTTTVDADWYGFKHLGYSDNWMGKNTALWLLRTPGGGGSCDASFVSDSGIVCYDYLTTFLGGVRPVILLADEPYTFDETVCYPKNALLEKEISHNPDGSSFVSEEYTYDANGNQLTKTRYYADGSVDCWCEYTYDANGNETSERWYNAAGSVWYWIELTYDENGNQTSQRYYNADGSVNWWDSWDATYDENGNQMSRRYYNDDGSASYYYEYTYNTNGNMTSERYYYADGSVDHWYEYTYDANGNMTSERYYNADGSVGGWTEYTYDANGNETSERYYYADGSVDFWYEYTYDANGNRTSARYYNAGGSVGDWYEYTYDENGNRLSERSYNADGSARYWYEYIYLN